MRLKILMTLLFSLAVLLAPRLAAAQFNPLNDACQGQAQNGPICKQNTTQQGSSANPALDRIHTAADIIAAVAGIAAVITIVLSAFTFATAGGAGTGQSSGANPARAKQARSTLIGAVVGLVIIALAWTIVTFVSNKVIK